MRITLKLYAGLTEYLPHEARESNRVVLDVAPQSSIAEVIAPLNLPLKMVHLVLINGIYVAPGERARRTLNDGDTLAIWPPIAGG